MKLAVSRVLPLLLLAAWLPAQACTDAELKAVLENRGAEPSLRQDALFTLQDRGVLDDALLARALGDDSDELVEAAQVVLLYERVPIGPRLLALASMELFGESRILAALARKRRPETSEWLLRRWNDQQLPLLDRLHAVAAMPTSALTRPMAKLIVDGAVDDDREVQDATWRAAANLTPQLADGLVAEVHRRSTAGTSIEQLIPVLARMSPAGEKQLLGLVSALGGMAQESVAQWLVARSSAGFQERMRAAVDGEIPLEPYLLTRCGGFLDSPERVARVVAILVKDTRAEVRQRAFDALLQAGVYDPAMRAYALDEEGDPRSRARLLGKLAPELLPDDVLRELLATDEDQVRIQVLRTLARRPLSKELEPLVLELALETDEEVAPSNVVADACRTIVTTGSEQALRALWISLRSRPRLHIDAILWMSNKPKPWVQALFLTELHDRPRPKVDPATEGAPNTSENVHDYLRLALARMGDRHLFDDMVSEAPRRTPWFLRRCREIVVKGMKPVHVTGLTAAVTGPDRTDDDDVRTELVRWLASRPDLDTVETLMAVWQKDASPEAREEALRGLLAGPERHAIFARLREQLGRDADEVRELAFEVVAAMRAPLSVEDLDLLARLLLEAPLTQSDEQVQRSRRFGTGRAGFPLVSAVVDRLRRDPEADPAPAFAKVAAEVRTHEHVDRITRERLLTLLTRAAIAPDVLGALGPSVAALLLAIPDDAELGVGVAQLLLAGDAERREQYAEAAERYADASRHLLRDLDDPWPVRTFLGVGDPVAGEHPLAALAARAPLCAARAALADGDSETARARLNIARELAAGDSRTERELEELMQQVKR